MALVYLCHFWSWAICLYSLLLCDRVDLGDRSMFVGDLGDTVHVKLRKHHLDLRPYGQQKAAHSGKQVFFLLGLNKFSGARIEPGPQVESLVQLLAYY